MSLTLYKSHDCHVTFTTGDSGSPEQLEIVPPHTLPASSLHKLPALSPLTRPRTEHGILFSDWSDPWRAYETGPQRRCSAVLFEGHRSMGEKLVDSSLYRRAGNFHCWVKFSLSGLKRYVIFVVCPEHVIIVAYCPWLLFECADIRGFIFFLAFRNENNENKTQRKFPTTV